MPMVVLSDGAQINVYDEGSGPVVLLVHGWSLNAGWWREQRAAMRDTHRVVSVELRGHGRSQKVAFGHRMSRYAADLEEILECMDLHRVVAVGWSLGASILLAFYDLFGPERLTGIVLVDQTPRCLTEEGWVGSLGELSRSGIDRSAGSVRSDRLGHASRFVPRMFRTPPDEGALERMFADVADVPTEPAAAILEDHLSQDWRDVVSRVRVPVLAIAGAHGRAMKGAAWIADNAPSGRFAVFEDSAHCPFLEEPDRFNGLLVEFAAECQKRIEEE